MLPAVTVEENEASAKVSQDTSSDPLREAATLEVPTRAAVVAS